MPDRKGNFTAADVPQREGSGWMPPIHPIPRNTSYEIQMRMDYAYDGSNDH